LLAGADVIVDGFRPGVLERLVGPFPKRAVVCSITGFGQEGPRAGEAGHDVNYLGYAGALWDTSPALPPVMIADLGAGSLGAVAGILGALLERERSGRGRRLDVSMTHGSHRLVSYRLGADPQPRLLTGGLACYRIYETADGRHVTVGALEPRFFARLCELLDFPEEAARQYDEAAQPALNARLASAFAARPLAEWLDALAGEDVCVGPVLTIAEAAAELGGEQPLGEPAGLGEHTSAWRAELGLA
jgi:crotonobetainyl-CoA:carnitine CoA-transferase CaiB-like acyl-CoA transferase